MQTVEVLFGILFIMYFVVLGLLVAFEIYTPPRAVIAMSFLMTAIFMTLLMFTAEPITKVNIYNY